MKNSENHLISKLVVLYVCQSEVRQTNTYSKKRQNIHLLLPGSFSLSESGRELQETKQGHVQFLLPLFHDQQKNEREN